MADEPEMSTEAALPRSWLTADLCARAMIASASAWGDDPERALMAQKGHLRRSIAPAVAAISDAVGLGVPTVAALLGTRADTVWRCRRTGGEAFDKAYDLARDAVDVEIDDMRREATPRPAAAPEPEPAPEAPPKVIEATGSEPEAAIATPPRSAPVGRLLMDTPRATSFHTWSGQGDGPDLASRILAQLRGRDWSAPSLATVLGDKELDVSRTLTQLAHEGRVVAGEVPFEGARFRRWRLADA